MYSYICCFNTLIFHQMFISSPSPAAPNTEFVSVSTRKQRVFMCLIDAAINDNCYYLLFCWLCIYSMNCYTNKMPKPMINAHKPILTLQKMNSSFELQLTINCSSKYQFSVQLEPSLS